MKPDLDKIKLMLIHGEVEKAIRLANRLIRMKEFANIRPIVEQAASAIENPSFYIQINKDPEHLIEKARFSIMKMLSDLS